MVECLQEWGELVKNVCGIVRDWSKQYAESYLIGHECLQEQARWGRNVCWSGHRSVTIHETKQEFADSRV